MEVSAWQHPVLHEVVVCGRARGLHSFLKFVAQHTLNAIGIADSLNEHCVYIHGPPNVGFRLIVKRDATNFKNLAQVKSDIKVERAD